MNEPVDSAVHALVNKVVKSEGIINPKIEVADGSAKGENYLGIINAVKINGYNKSLSVIVKTAHKNEKFREQAHLAQIFANEIYFYNEIFPKYRQFQLEKQLEDRFDSIARCYTTSVEELHEGLVLENLRDSGYQMWDRRKPMNSGHVSFVLREYGRFHAVGFALKDQDAEAYDELASKVVDIFEKYGQNEENVRVFGEMTFKARECLDPVEDKAILERFDDFLKNFMDLQEKMRKAADSFTVIAHGDCWCNNMMFKYKDAKQPMEPTNMRFLDWQVWRVVSPVVDIAHFFYSVANKEALDNLKHYKSVYYDSLSSYLKQLGSDPEKVYPLSVFDDQWKKYCIHGFFVSLFMLKIMVSESDEAPDVTQAEKGKMMDMFKYEPRNTEYKRRIRDNIIHFVSNDFL